MELCDSPRPEKKKKNGGDFTLQHRKYLAEDEQNFSGSRRGFEEVFRWQDRSS